jgi:phosphatidylserine/phosphatidylglycerophosphate/cardiolipin synthase-like enzyme
MDPGLWELIEAGDREDEVAAILRLRDPAIAPAGVRVISQFGSIATVRLKRDDILKIRADAATYSLKAPLNLTAEQDALVTGWHSLPAEMLPEVDERRPQASEATGRGVVIGIVDWGCDVAHPDFRRPDGTTRLLALWDQQARPEEEPANHYGYGRIHTAEAINHALATPDPYAALDYHPADSDSGRGAHGTHCLSIAAGNGSYAGGSTGVAPEADLVFVHLATWGNPGLARLGDSVTLLEAVDFIARTAGERPWVVSLSMGRHSGEHDGLSPVEQGLDAAVTAAPGRCIVQSCGNYYDRRAHSFARLRPGEERTLTVDAEQAGVIPHEVDVWYPGRDRLIVEIYLPDSTLARRVALGDQGPISIQGQEVGKVYHRARDPNNLDNQINLFIYPSAPAGEWRLTLIGEDVVDGRVHAWIERDAACRYCQPHFDMQDAVPTTTTGTICNGFHTIAVGAYNPHSPGWELAPFSSSGPTRDGRQKPDLIAPGVYILAARSTPRDPDSGASLLVRRSGTSMAAPHVAGAVALMFQVAPRPLWVHETRALLLASADQVTGPAEMSVRVGSGRLNIDAAIEAASNPDSSPALGTTQEKGMGETTMGEQQISDEPHGVEFESEDKEVFSDGMSVANITDAEAEAKGNGEANEHLVPDTPVSMERTEADEAGGAEAEPPCRCHARLVEAVDAAISARQGVYPSSALLQQVLGKTVTPPGSGRLPSAAEIFDAFAYPGREALRSELEQYFELVAPPNSFLGNVPEPGDLIVRRGEGGFGHIAIIAAPEQWSYEQLAVSGLVPETDRPGEYVQVVEGGVFPHSLNDNFARRLTDADGRVPHAALVLHPREDNPSPTLRRVDPAYWFLTEAEIGAARGGGAGGRRTLSVFTSQNLVEPLIDGEQMMRALHGDLTATNPGDFIHFTAWRMDHLLDLMPHSPPRVDSRTDISHLWAAASSGPRRVTSRTLLSRALIPRSLDENIMTQHYLHLARGEAVLDARFPAAGSHHQKSAIVQHNGETIAYCGGIDLAGDRWDTRQHNNDPRRVREEWYGWHDVHTRIRGPAVRDIEHNFRDRWNDSNYPMRVPLPVSPPTQITGPLPPVSSAPGTHHVQVLRTCACTSRQYPTFAPNGEFTCLAGYRKAIRRATNYIYIEDQYLVFDEIARELAAALARIQKLIIVVPHHNTETWSQAFNWHQNNFLRILRAVHPGKVHVYHLIQPATGQPIYVHAKVMLIDDIYAVIGSANINRRSMTHDTELAVAIIDAALDAGICRFARDLRRNLWGEHLGLSASDPRLADPVAAVAEWERQATAGVYRVRHHTTPQPQEEDTIRWDRILDPDGRC